MADNVIHISEQARERYHDCLKAIEEARAWVGNREVERGEIDEEGREQLVEMERTFLANVARLFFTPASDGMLTIHTDIAPLSFFWRYESGYHGGLIFHARAPRVTVGMTVDGMAIAGPPPVGTWSVHT